MYEEVFEGMLYTNEQIAEMFGVTFDEDLNNGQSAGDMVVVRDIEVFSYCEHHLALMYDMKITVAYIPNGKVIGLSKIARIAEMVAKRLQLQERIGRGIADIMQMVTGSEDVAVLIDAKSTALYDSKRVSRILLLQHITTTLRGRFKTDQILWMRLKG